MSSNPSNLYAQITNYKKKEADYEKVCLINNYC